MAGPGAQVAGPITERDIGRRRQSREAELSRARGEAATFAHLYHEGAASVAARRFLVAKWPHTDLIMPAFAETVFSQYTARPCSRKRAHSAASEAARPSASR